MLGLEERIDAIAAAHGFSGVVRIDRLSKLLPRTRFGGDVTEPSLHQIEPRRARRSEMQMGARVLV